MSTFATRERQRPALLAYAAQELGVVLFVADLSWDHAEAHVVEVVDATDTSWIVKHCFRAKVFARETTALREWVPALGPGRAPALYASDESSRMFITRRLPGRAGTAETPAEFRQAGELLRRLHDAGPGGPIPDFADLISNQLEGWLKRLPGIADPRDVDFARSRVRDLKGLPPPESGWCHGDNQPRNWLVDESGTVALIDFGRANVGARLRDFERMYFAEWVGQPRLSTAYFEGYGRELRDSEVETLRCVGSAVSVSGRLWAREHKNPAFEQHQVETTRRLRRDEI